MHSNVSDVFVHTHSRLSKTPGWSKQFNFTNVATSVTRARIFTQTAYVMYVAILLQLFYEKNANIIYAYLFGTTQTLRIYNINNKLN